MRFIGSALLLLLFSSPGFTQQDDLDKLKVGIQPDGRIVVPTNQILQPAGRQITFPGRPVDLLLIDYGKTLVVHNKNNLVFIDVASEKIKQTLPSPVGLSVTGLTGTSERVYTSDVKDHVRVAERQNDGSYKWGTPIEVVKPQQVDKDAGKPVAGSAHPAGMAFVGKDLWVTSTRGNNVQRIDLASGKVVQVIPVGVAPFTIYSPRPDRAYVTNWGGDHPGEKDPKGISSKTPVKIDPKTGVANHGSVSVLVESEGKWKVTKSITVGLHPSGITGSMTGKFLYVANANSDTVSIIDTAKEEVIETINCRPDHRLPFGSGCNALALGPMGNLLYVANGSNNCVSVIQLSGFSAESRLSLGRQSTVTSRIPTGWYPGAIRVSADGKTLFVANIKGLGSLSEQKGKGKKNSHDHLGSVSIINVNLVAALRDEYSAQVNANNRLSLALAGLAKPRPDAKRVPVPERHGEPSVFDHVIYIIKENRTYDQVFGDMKEGKGEPKLVMFGEKVTPNHHALARQFTLLDNFYCSGVLSADGHSWVNEAYVTDYLERSFGGFTRSYPFEGSDQLAFAPSGFLWDNALANKKSVRIYGEFARTIYTPAKPSWTDLYQDFVNGTNKIKFQAKTNWPTLEKYTHPGYPGFSMVMPDVYRARIFLEEFRQFEKEGKLPNLIYLFLPTDHTSGTRPDAPTPRAMVADNDLAVGRVVEAVTKSKFWAKTCIFIVEDDPQNGFDHIDGHRTVAMAISPYTRRKHVDSTNYTQTGMVKTIELVLGLPPMNQHDLAATAMRNCFQDKADLTPFTSVPNQTALDEMNPPLKKLKGQALLWAKKSLELNLDECDAADEDTFNRILWHATRGDAPYPAEYVGRRSPARQRAMSD